MQTRTMQTRTMQTRTMQTRSMQTRIMLRWIFLLTLVASEPCLSAQGSDPAPRLQREGLFTYESFGEGPSDGTAKPVVILLHGASGPAVPFYQDQARFFESHGFTVLLPHYFDATKGRNTPSDGNYRAWVDVVKALVAKSGGGSGPSGPAVFLMGYSLGASVALAAGSELVPVNAIAEWYGSLPDAFFFRMRGMPPLLILHGAHDDNVPVVNAQQLIRLCGMRKLTCVSHIYPDAGHGFAGKDEKDAEARTLTFFASLARTSSSP